MHAPFAPWLSFIYTCTVREPTVSALLPWGQPLHTDMTCSPSKAPGPHNNTEEVADCPHGNSQESHRTSLACPHAAAFCVAMSTSPTCCLPCPAAWHWCAVGQHTPGPWDPSPRWVPMRDGRGPLRHAQLLEPSTAGDVCSRCWRGGWAPPNSSSLSQMPGLQTSWIPRAAVTVAREEQGAHPKAASKAGCQRRFHGTSKWLGAAIGLVR